ncbi:hypothetical protein KKD62_01860 [Patescibacteria group bacterium]|nr:hypothetical protein [Patescibacteria group bacterium]MBU1931097.1 hypothetical protein [Patescibacteria group bacterium]
MNKKKNLTITISLITTVILAGVAILTAQQLQQISYKKTKPTVPEQPWAQEAELPCSLDFTVVAPTPTPTPTGTPTPSPTPTNTPTPTPTGTPTPTPTGTPTPSPTPTNTPTPTPSNTPTPTPTNTPTPTPTLFPALACIDLITDNNTPSLGDEISFTCVDTGTENYGPDRFDFRYSIDAGGYNDIPWIASSLRFADYEGVDRWMADSQSISIDIPGTYNIQCRVCRESNCTTWGAAE